MINGYEGSVYGAFRTNKFSDIYSNVNDFKNDYIGIGIPTTIDTTDLTTLYYLLYANYGNSHIASFDLTQFKYKLFSTIWQYGPTWSRQVGIQKRLRELNEEDILQGSKQIYNNANNPSVEPTTDTTDELTFINQQNVTKNKKGVLEAYGLLDSLLKKDVTQDFLNKFKKLFLTVVQPESPFLYEEIEDEY